MEKKDSVSNSRCLGIDLGTTNSCIGIWENGGVTIIKNEYGVTTTPSVVFYPKDNGVAIVGRAAVAKLSRVPSRTIYGAKRLIGSDFSEQWAREFNYQIISDEKDNNVIKLSDRVLYPEQVSSEVLKKMRQIAEDHLGGETVDRAVITVPAYFNDKQRYATRVAAELAGLEVTRMINEPTAACLCYGMDKLETDCYILVYDCGGGTLDVSLLSLNSGLFEVVATSGDCELGGIDFDRELAKHFCREKGLEYNRGSDAMSLNPSQLNRLTEACETLKIQLSYTDRAQITIENFFTNDQIIKRGLKSSDLASDSDDDHPYDLTLTICLDQWITIVEPVLDRAVKPVLQVLQDSKIDRDEIEQIVLVGGSTRLRAIQERLVKLFPGKTLNKSINPDEAVAYGATIQAAILGNETDSKIQEMVLVDVTPLSLGIETEGGLMSVIVPRNTSIPTEKRAYYTTTENNQTSVTVEIFQGERALTSENRVLGRFNLDGIPPYARGLPKIRVNFKIDANGLLDISAEDEISGVEQKVIIDSSTTRLSKEEIETRVKQAETNKREDEMARQIVNQYQKCYGILRELRRVLDDHSEHEWTQKLRQKTNLMFAQLEEIWKSEEVCENKYSQLEKFEKSIEQNLLPLFNNLFRREDKINGDNADESNGEFSVSELNDFLESTFSAS